MSAFSPPDSSVTLWSLLPGGWAQHLDTGLEQVRPRHHDEAGAAAVKEAREDLPERRFTSRKASRITLSTRLVDLSDGCP